jgi:hypothetical protein
MACSISRRNIWRTLPSMMSSSMSATRAAKRSTLPSTAGTGREKAMEAIAPAV